MPGPRLVALRGDESDLFARHHDRLRRAVRRSVNTSPDVVEDACQIAWTILLRRQPDRGPTLFAWLKTVAVHEAYRLHRADRATVALDAVTGAVDKNETGCTTTWQRHLGQDGIEDQLEARRALRALADLPDRQRRYLTWKAAGFSYDEIRDLAGGVTRTNVNKHLARARRRMRDERAAYIAPDPVADRLIEGDTDRERAREQDTDRQCATGLNGPASPAPGVGCADRCRDEAP